MMDLKHLRPLPVSRPNCSSFVFCSITLATSASRHNRHHLIGWLGSAQRRARPIFLSRSQPCGIGPTRWQEGARGSSILQKPYQFVRADSGNEPVIYGGDWQVCEFAADDETIQQIVMEYSKIKGDDTLGNSTRSMPNWHTSGLSEKGDTKAVLASNKKACQPSDLEWLTGYLWLPRCRVRCSV